MGDAFFYFRKIVTILEKMRRLEGVTMKMFWKSVVLCVACLWMAHSAVAGPVDNSQYAELLSAHVRNGVVDYAGLKKKEATLDGYLAVLQKVHAEVLSEDEQIAYWINVYNAWTLKLILENYPGISSIRDIGGLFQSPWKIRFVKANGTTLHLDEVEKVILHRFKEPRIHFAINCASKSCPELLNVPYEGAQLEKQLAQQTRKFLNDERFNRLEGKTLYVSKIFDWYEEELGDAASYVSRYAKAGLAQKIQALGDDVQVRYLKYDWSLNGK